MQVGAPNQLVHIQINLFSNFRTGMDKNWTFWKRNLFSRAILVLKGYISYTFDPCEGIHIIEEGNYISVYFFQINQISKIDPS